MRDILIVFALLCIVIVVKSTDAASSVNIITFLVVGFAGLYVSIMGLIPHILSNERGVVEYRSEYGFVRKIPMDKIVRLTLGTGFGGFEHALFIYHLGEDGTSKRTKVKIDYFDEREMRDFIVYLQTRYNVEISEELKRFMSK
jgi:hypothetical protein